MGFDMSLSGEGKYITMNWLRNPFGLTKWLEDNVERPETDLPSVNTICNRWTYSNSDKIDRELFLNVILSYKTGVEKLERGFYYFNLREYRCLVEPKAHLMEKESKMLGGTDIKGLEYAKDGRVRIPLEVYAKYPHAESHSTIEYYKKWFKELLDFAEQLQDKSLTFYCDN